MWAIVHKLKLGGGILEFMGIVLPKKKNSFAIITEKIDRIFTNKHLTNFN